MSPETPAQPAEDKEVVAKPGHQAPAVEEKASRKPASSGKGETLKAERAVNEKKVPQKQPKLVRDSFTIPEADYELFANLKQRALAAGVEVKKSELLRAGLALLEKLDDAEFIKAIGLVERIKTGRPRK